VSDVKIKSLRRIYVPVVPACLNNEPFYDQLPSGELAITSGKGYFVERPRMPLDQLIVLEVRLSIQLWLIQNLNHCPGFMCLLRPPEQ